MDEPARRVLYRFMHGESVQQYRSEFGFNVITLLRRKMYRNGLKLVYDVHVDVECRKIMDCRIIPNFGLIRCSKVIKLCD